MKKTANHSNLTPSASVLKTAHTSLVLVCYAATQQSNHSRNVYKWCAVIGKPVQYQRPTESNGTAAVDPEQGEGGIFFQTPMTKPPGGPGGPTHPPSLFGPSAGAGASSTSACVKCEMCGESWGKSKIQQHVGAHILEEHWKQWPSKKQPRYPCGLCGLRGALGGDTKKAQDEGVSGCYMWIDQNGKKAMHECKLLGSVSYNLKYFKQVHLLDNLSHA